MLLIINTQKHKYKLVSLRSIKLKLKRLTTKQISTSSVLMFVRADLSPGSQRLITEVM